MRMLLADIDQAGNPAAELPRIDRRARESGTALESMCHPLMHEVRRRYGAEHHVTLADLMDYIPRSNDPTCSAGFGMGLVMYLGPQIILTGGRSALAQCLRLPTRYRSYTCVHGIGHALMRGYHGRLRQSVAACRKLGEQAPDCAQGAFHDYWISLRGADGTVRRANGDVAALPLQRPPLVRAPVLVPLLRRGRDRAALRRSRVDSHGVRRAPRAAALRLRERGGARRSRRIRSRRRASARGSRADAGACLRGAAVQGSQPSRRSSSRSSRLCTRNRHARRDGRLSTPRFGVTSALVTGTTASAVWIARAAQARR